MLELKLPVAVFVTVSGLAPQTLTVTWFDEEVPAAAVFVYVAQVPVGAVIVREYLNTPLDGEVIARTQSVPALVLAVVVPVTETVPSVATQIPPPQVSVNLRSLNE